MPRIQKNPRCIQVSLMSVLGSFEFAVRRNTPAGASMEFASNARIFRWGIDGSRRCWGLGNICFEIGAPLILVFLFGCTEVSQLPDHELAPARTTEDYAFIGRLKAVGRLPHAGGPTISTYPRDERWFAEFVIVETVRGIPPGGPERLARYAVHSLSDLDLLGSIGKNFRIEAKVVSTGATQVHQCQIMREP